jgi:hypothetical protein
MICSGASDDTSNTARAGTHYLQRPTRPGAAQIRASIGCVFMLIITELKTCHIYKAVLQTINTVV